MGKRKLEEEIVLKMLEYSSKTFEKVDKSFFKGVQILTAQIGRYLAEKGYHTNDNRPSEKESINYWRLAQVSAEKVKPKPVTNSPWRESLMSAELAPDSKYLPYGVNEKNADKKLMWHQGWTSVDHNRKRLKREIPIEKITEIIEDFYSAISPMYGEMAHNELRNAKLTIPMEWYNDEDYVFNIVKQGIMMPEFTLNEAHSMNIPIAGNYYTAMAMAHELMHRFITINEDTSILKPEQIQELESYKNGEKTPDFLNELILKETCSIYAEQLFADYLKEHYQDADTLQFFADYRWKFFDRFSKHEIPNDYIGDLDRWLKISKFYKENGKITDEEMGQLLDSITVTREWQENTELPEMYTSQLLSRIAHVMGYAYATYLHERTLSGKLDSKEALNKCTAAYVCSYSDEKKQMKLLGEIGAPFIKWGRFVIDGETIDVLFNSVKADVDRRADESRECKGVFEDRVDDEIER